MALIDTLIAGGTVVTGAGEFPIDIGIRNGRISLWAERDLAVDATERIDVSGLMVLPGAIDAHVHMREPGLVYKEGFSTGSMAAVAGGVTTIMVMPTDKPWTEKPADFSEKRELAERSSYADFALQAAARLPDQVAALAALGASSFEIFLGDVPTEWVINDAGQLKILVEAIANSGCVAGITPADDGVINAAIAREAAEGTKDRMSFFRTRPPVSEVLGVSRACAIAAATGARMHLRQISCAASLEAFKDIRAKRSNISAEVTPHNLYLTEDELQRQGPWAKVLPPLRKASDLTAMWRALVSGDIDIVASDHAPHAPEEKRAGESDITKAPGGLPGVQTLLPLMLDAVAARRLSWTQLVRICAEMPAKLFGINEKKGSLDLGKDADIVIVNPSQSWTIRNEDQKSKARVTPFAGRSIRGKPKRVLLRGRTVMKDDVVAIKPFGVFVAGRV